MKRIKVGGVHYEVREVPELMRKYNLFGQVTYSDAVIEVERELPEERKEQVIIHELVHAMLFEAGIEEQDEDLVNRLGKVLHQVLRDNPNLLKPRIRYDGDDS